jgi:hypothetical protein
MPVFQQVLGWGGGFERGGEANVLPSVVVALASPKERTSRGAFGSLLGVWLRPPIQNTPYYLLRLYAKIALRATRKLESKQRTVAAKYQQHVYSL